jgi:lipopolysaccharide heptosyltransferase II
MRLGVFLPNWIGDVVMATPALRALRKHFGPEAHLVGVMRPYVAEVLAGESWFDETVVYAKQSAPDALSGREAVLRLRAAKLDQILLLTNSFRTAWMAWRSGALRRAGIRGEGRGWLLTERTKQPIDAATGLPWASIATYLHLAEAIGCPAEPPRLELATVPADERAADAVWQRLGLPRGDDVVIFNTGGAFGSAKNWPVEHFAELAQRIVADRKLTVLVNCGPKERDTARAIVAQASDPHVVGLADETELPIGLTKACIRRTRLLVTTDSGPRYLGIAFERPVVTLFGPTDPRLVESQYERETCLSLGLKCQPCMKRSCPLGHHRCMRDLTVDRVYAAVATHLDANAWVAGVEVRPSPQHAESLGAR